MTVNPKIRQPHFFLQRVALGTAVLVLACGGAEQSASHDTLHDTGGVATEADHADHGDPAAAEEGHGHAPAASGGQTLIVIMQQLGGHMTSLTHALMIGDKAGVTTHATAIAEHPPIASDDLERIKTLLGADMTQFEAADVSVHNAAVRLRNAAQAGETQAILTRLNELQRGCIGCHDQFQQRLRTQPAP